MRNLSVLSSTVYKLPPGYNSHVVSAATIDAEEDTLLVASESARADDVTIQVWKVDAQDRLHPLASTTCPSVSESAPQIVSFTVVADTRTVCVITRAGDIAILPLELDSDTAQSLNIVGTLTPGVVHAVALSPDSSLLVIITSTPPSPTLHLMSPSTFTLISSTPLTTQHRGAAAPINVGWGSKSTQFHGSLGKSAAQAQPATESGCTTTPDDDGAPRASWRGDAQFFVVSALEGGVLGKRVLRVYNRAGVLQSTAEDVPGLEHVLAWQPNGGLIASMQRFGKVPGETEREGVAWALGKGIDGRHDVVFFERNGLRHGEFMLRESSVSPGKFTTATSDPSNASSPLVPDRRWRYKVRELGWNVDSSVLSVWVERETGDVVQLWTTGNYHWYLKFELPAPGAGRFTTVSWHAEDPLRLVLSTADRVICTRYIITTASSPSSCGTGLVGVVDGDALLLTPFRTQNIPPPMSSARLSLSLSPAQPQTHPYPPPLHIAFAPLNDHVVDVLATLSASGSVAMWKICTPLAVKKGKRDVVIPTLLWRGDVPNVGQVRQVCVRGGENEGEWVLGVLGQREGDGEGRTDVIWFNALFPNIPTLSPSLLSMATESELTGSAFLLGVARTWEVRMPGRGGRIVDDEGGTHHPEGGGRRSVVWEAKDGGLWEVSLRVQRQGLGEQREREGHKDDDDDGDEAQQHLPTLVSRFPKFCASAVRVSICGSGADAGSGSGSGSPVVPVPHSFLFVGLSGAKLHIVASSPSGLSSDTTDSFHHLTHTSRQRPRPTTHTLSHTCTSFIIAAPYLVWTSTTSPTHEAMFARLGAVADGLARGASDMGRAVHTGQVEKRRIERGARIVTVVPSTMSLVLQMPRGNLETVMPRPLVMEQVRADVQRGEYRAAFLACRKHRVDLNLLVELGPTAFVESIPAFVEQLDDVDHINLFLSGLGRSSLPAQTIGELCDGIREELERRDVRKYVNSILTAHVVKTPPDYEAGLSLLLRLRGTDKDKDLVEDAVKYIIFLVDADRLFDTALGMYDFSLVLLVAQYSQKDPREYLPFLRSLRAQEGAYQHFMIDDHLKRYEKALRSLHQACAGGGGDGERERFEEAKSYVAKHELYGDALRLWKEKGEREEYDEMLELYGDDLVERREFRNAALVYVQGSRFRKAMAAYEKGLEWQELFDLVVREGIKGDTLVGIARRIADELGAKQRHVEAARVLLDYTSDVDAAVASFVNGSAWSEARRIATLHDRNDLVALSILPGALEARSSISDEVDEIRGLLEKQVARLDELMKKRTSEPEAFYGVEDANLTNVDVMTDVSNPGTMFTRYTVAPTTSDRSRRTSRSKRKLDRKAGRKGTVEEEEYLLQSLTKLVARLDAVRAECRALLPHLLSLCEEQHASEACDLQDEVEGVEQAMRSVIERIWAEREGVSGSSDRAGTGGGGGSSQEVKLTDKVPRPSIPDVCWKIRWIGGLT